MTVDISATKSSLALNEPIYNQFDLPILGHPASIFKNTRQITVNEMNKTFFQRARSCVVDPEPEDVRVQATTAEIERRPF